MIWPKSISACRASSAATAFGPSPLGRVKVTSVCPSAPRETFCTTMSMSISASATVRKMRAATPGRSGTLVTVSLASPRSCATPVISACSIGSSSTVPVTVVPIRFEYDDRTWTGTP